MNIIEPKVELWEQGNDPVSHIAKCARVCYGKTEGKSTDRQLVENLLKARHFSMFRHESVYSIIPNSEAYEFKEALKVFELGSPYIDIRHDMWNTYVVANGNFRIDYGKSQFGQLIKKHQTSPQIFNNTNNGDPGHSMMRYTFHITTQISTSRELNRVSPNNIAERSSRYVREDGTIVRPHWISKQIADAWNKDILTHSTPEAAYLSTCDYAFRDYEFLIANGIKRQDARGVLPLDTATEVVYTYSIEEWKKIIALRSDKKAHPNCQIIANMIKEQLKQLGYEF